MTRAETLQANSKDDSEPAQTQPTENGTVTTAPDTEAPDTTTTSFDVQSEDNITNRAKYRRNIITERENKNGIFFT